MNEELKFSLKKIEEVQLKATNLTERYLDALQETENCMNALEEYMNTHETGIYQKVMDCYKNKKRDLEKLGEIMKQTCLSLRDKQLEFEDKIAYLNSNIE